MARVALTANQVVRTGFLSAPTAAETDGNSWNNTGKEILHVINGATDVLVTINTPRGPDGQDVTERVVTVSASSNQYLGPFPPETFNQRGSAGDVVHVDYDVITNVTVEVLRF